MRDALDVGVVGVGSMGRQHARVYAELPGVRLVGVSDVDRGRAAETAEAYATEAMPRLSLLDRVDAVSVAVPDEYHYEVARAAIDAGVHVLVEKPFVQDRARGAELVEDADAAGLVLQVGHVERFNPAVLTLSEVVEHEELISLDARRLGPPLGRTAGKDPVIDLMIHDLDLVAWLVDEPIQSIQAVGAASQPHVTALVVFESDVFAALTASRATQRKVRKLGVTAEGSRITVDYVDQTVEVHRRSVPSYLESDGDLRYRHESVVEQPMVDRGEPLKNELASFVEAVVEGRTPEVSGEDGLRALDLVEQVQRGLNRAPVRTTETV